MAKVKINHINKIEPNIFIISTSNGLVIKKDDQEIRLLEGLVINETSFFPVEVIDPSIDLATRIIIKARNSIYVVSLDLDTFTVDPTSDGVDFFLESDQRITAVTSLNDFIYYTKEPNENGLYLGKVKDITKNVSETLIDPLSKFEKVIGLFNDSVNKIYLVTESRIIEFDTSLNVITNSISLSSANSVTFDGSNFYVSTYINTSINTYDTSLTQTSSNPFSNGFVNSILVENNQIYLSFGQGLYQVSTNSVLVTNLTLNSVLLDDINYINTGTEIRDLNNNVIFTADTVNRDKIPNLIQATYKSKSVVIPTNNATASFSWEESGPTNNYQVSLTANQSTDLVNFSDFSDPSTSNKGVFVPNITPLTQAVGFELFTTLSNQSLTSPIISNFKLTTNAKSTAPENPVDLIKAETLNTHTSYSQKFFKTSTVIRRHDSSFKEESILDSSFENIFESTPYGFQYEFKNKVRDQFGQYSKESYNPLHLDYTKKTFPLSAAPVQNVNFTVLNPSEIFINWDTVTELIDGTPIPSSTIVSYKILRKDESNAIYKTIFADNLISLNLDYVTSEEPVNTDIKQLTDGISGPTHNEEDSALIFIDPVSISFDLNTSQIVDKINLSFVKDYGPKKIFLTIFNGGLASDTYEFDNLDFTLDKDLIEEISINNIGLQGDKVEIFFELNDTEEIKITEVEIYKGVDVNNPPLTYYRDLDINFKDGSQYYYLVQAQLDKIVTPTNFTKETQTIKLGNKAILGLTDSTDKVFKLSLNNNSISKIEEQELLPIKLQDLSSVLLGDNIVSLGGRLENAATNLTSSLTFLSEINGQILTEIISKNKGPFTVVSGVNDQLIFSVNKRPPITITLPAGTNSAIQIAFAINQQLNNSVNYGPSFNNLASSQSSRVKLSESRDNPLNRIVIENGSANDLLGFTNNDLGIFRPRIDMRSNRAYHSSLVMDNKIFVFGGMYDSINKLATNEVLRSFINDSLTNLSLFDSVQLLPNNLYGHAVASKDTYVYLLGGITDSEQYTDRVYLASYNSGTELFDNWIQTSALPFPLAFASVEVVGDYIYLIGGKKQDGTILSDIYSAPINSNYRLEAWQKIGQLPHLSYLATSVTKDSKIYIIGGKTKNNRLTRSIYGIELDLNGNIITIDTEKSLPLAIAGSSSVIKDNEIYLIGGEVNAGYSLGQKIEIQPPQSGV